MDTCGDEHDNSTSWSCSCNPPAVPYLGMYLTDLAFIEEGTPNFTEEGLVNFSKMRMVGENFIQSGCLSYISGLQRRGDVMEGHCFLRSR